MRKAFRTTIDENILASLKKEAIDRNVNVNDLIEEMAVNAMADKDQAAKAEVMWSKYALSMRVITNEIIMNNQVAVNESHVTELGIDGYFKYTIKLAEQIQHILELCE